MSRLLTSTATAAVLCAYGLSSYACLAAGATTSSELDKFVSVKAFLPLRDTDVLDSLIDATSDPDNAKYLQFVTDPAQLGKLFGSSDEDLDVVQTWMVKKLGCEEHKVRIASTKDIVICDKLLVDKTLRNTNAWDEETGQLAEDYFPKQVSFVLHKDLSTLSQEPLVITESNSGSSSYQARKEQLWEMYGQPDSFYSISNIKKAYGIPEDHEASTQNLSQMVWGPGTFGYDKMELESWAAENCPKINLKKVVYDTKNHGVIGGDNFGEGTLDTRMTSAFGLNVTTIVSNTNTSSSTEEGNGFGEALLDFLTELYARDTVPDVLSMSLGSLSGASCDLLCSEAAKEGHSEKDCNDFLQQQRQVCMFLSQDQTLRINQALQLLGIRGITVLGSSGDGGSHFSFAPFEGGAIAHTLNEISCKFQIPVFPTSSPYVLSVGGEAWEGLDYKKPIAWSGSGGGFSWQFERLSHQKNIIANYLNSTEGVPESSSFNSSGRAYPDVAAVSVDGTSQSCPTVAGILSLVIDYRKSQGLPGLGFIAPRLYQVATQYPGEAFEDITKGNTKTSCDNGFPAAKGWDPVTGWGRPQWAGLLKHFGSDDFL